jgi:serine-type D-Ala-D-Ala carboxypeptidase (penicillin-binding protein 5/6)
MRRSALAAALAATAALAGCGSAGPAAPTAASRPAAVTSLQVANGPLAAPRDPGAVPLRLRLTATADPVRVRFGDPPRAGLLFDLDTGRVLWRRRPLRIVPIASLTKMMTALLVVGAERPEARVLITRQAVDTPGSKVGLLPKGKRVPLEALLFGLLLPSGNDAATALAQATSGSVTRFVALMNQHARDLGLRCSRFSSPSGIVDAGNHSCAADLAGLARAVLDQPRLARIVRRRRAVLRFPIKGHHLELYNNNPLLRIGYPGVIGVKTGYTNAAGHCLVAAARRGGRRLGVVLLHSPDTGRQARRLFDRGFAVQP